MYPHEFLAVLYRDHRDSFDTHILNGSASNIPKFWDEVVDHPCYASHPMHAHSLSDFRTHAIPIRLYGDGTPVTGIGKAWKKEVDTIIFSSCLVTSGDPWLNNIIIAFLYDLMLLVDDNGNRLTEFVVWREIVWSLYWAYQGTFPDRGSDNIPYTDAYRAGRAGMELMGGLFIVLWVLMGDLDYMFKRMFMADYNSKSPCSSCRCNTTDIPWTDTRDGVAQWQLELWTNLAYAMAYPRRHGVLRNVPGVGINTYIPDVMHCKYLGSDKSFCGSVIKNLITYILPGSEKDNLKTIWYDIVREYKRGRVPSRFQAITANMVQGPSKKNPELRGKAAQIRDLVPILIKLWSNRMDTGNPQHRDVLTGLQCSYRIDCLLHEHKGKPRMPPRARIQFRAACFGFADAQSALVDAYHPNTPLHNISSKTHYIMHLGMIAQYINPHQGACWQGEDMMRVSRRLLQSASPGSRIDVSMKTAMDKYVAALSFEFNGDGRVWASI